MAAEGVIKPDVCTSMRCYPPKKYCRECSHAIFYGELMVNGRSHRFEFSPQYGPTFLTVMGTPRQVQPGEKNPVWGEFEKWMKEKFHDKK